MTKKKDEIDAAAEEQAKAAGLLSESADVAASDPAAVEAAAPVDGTAAGPFSHITPVQVEARKPKNWEPPHITVPVASKFGVSLVDTTVTVVFEELADANYFYDLLVPHAVQTATVEPVAKP